MSDTPYFSIAALRPVNPASRPAPASPVRIVDRGFSGRLGQVLGRSAPAAPLDAEEIAAASELMLNQGVMDILADGEPGEAGSDAAAMNSLLLSSLLGEPGGGGLPAGLGDELSALVGSFPGGAEALVAALRQGLAGAAAPAAPAPDPTSALAPAALTSPAADPAPNLALHAGRRAYARNLPGEQGEAGEPAPAVLRPAATPRPDAFSALLGRLSARFESGGDPAAVGYDRVGGTSYGIYQISSRAGTMDQFLGFLEARRPEWAASLEAAGPANTGGTSGGMPAAWRAIAAADPEGFAQIQHAFIGQHHFLPAAQRIRELTGLNLADNPALAEVLWSTAVQHGVAGAASIVSGAAEAAGPSGSPNFASSLVGEIYKRRAGRFSSSEAPVQDAVRSRLLREREEALTLLQAGGLLDSKV